MIGYYNRISARYTETKNCYDCRFCRFTDYGIGGICQKDVHDMPFSTLGQLFEEWEEDLGSNPFWAKRCLDFKTGTLQAIKKRILKAQIALEMETDLAHKFESDFWVRNGFTYWMREEEEV